jgi:hypothetical protein
VAAGERAEEDLVLAEEPGQQRDPGDRERADQERPVGDRHLALQPAHVPHVLLAASAWITAPEPRKSSALKKACV